jgi:hypothetical protein
MKSILAVLALVLLVPHFAQAATACDCQVGKDSITGKSYFKTICHRNRNGVPSPRVREYRYEAPMGFDKMAGNDLVARASATRATQGVSTPTKTANISYTGFENMTKARLSLSTYTQSHQITCAQTTQIAGQ